MQGSCLCGGVVFQVDPPLRGVIECHCGQCRRTSGHSWAASSVPHDRFHLIRDETLVWYRSSPAARRGLCGRCGSSLFWQPEGEARISFAAGALDGETGLTVDSQWFAEDAGDYAPRPDDTAGQRHRAPIAPPSAIAGLHGGCLCGAVRYESGPATGEVLACHCHMCRKSSGHFWVGVPVSSRDFRLTAATGLAWYRSSAQVRRGFCRDCGASALWQADGAEEIYLGAGTIDPPTGLCLAGHIFVADKGDYYAIDDGLPQSAGWT